MIVVINYPFIVPIELPKLKESKEKEELIKWVKFMKNPYGAEVEQMAKTDEEIAEARRKLDEINADKELVAILEKQDFARWDYNSAISQSKRDGLKERNRETEEKNGLEQRGS